MVNPWTAFSKISTVNPLDPQVCIFFGREWRTNFWDILKGLIFYGMGTNDLANTIFNVNSSKTKPTICNLDVVFAILPFPDKKF